MSVDVYGFTIPDRWLDRLSMDLVEKCSCGCGADIYMVADSEDGSTTRVQRGHVNVWNFAHLYAVAYWNGLLPT